MAISFPFHLRAQELDVHSPDQLFGILSLESRPPDKADGHSLPYGWVRAEEEPGRGPGKAEGSWREGWGAMARPFGRKCYVVKHFFFTHCPSLISVYIFY